MSKTAKVIDRNAVLFRAGTVAPSSANEEARTVRATISTGAAVTRSLWGERWVEKLDLSAINTPDVVGLSVVDSHNVTTTDSIRGVVLDAGRDNAGIWADMRIDDEATWARIKARSLRSISIGYQVDHWSETRTGDGGLLERTATDWRIVEVSLVVVPADTAAKIRSAVMPEVENAQPVEVIQPAPASSVAPVVPAVEPNATRAAPPAEAPKLINRAAVNAEIRTAAKIAGLPQEWVDAQIDAGVTSEAARAAAWAEMEKRAVPLVQTAHAIQDHSDPSAIRKRMADAVAARLTRQAPPDNAREFMPWTAVDMMIDLANRRGAALDPRNRTAAVDFLFTRAGAHSTSDFPLLLQDAANKILLPRYMEAAPSYRRFSAQRSFNDFKDHKFLRLGDFPALQEIKESGEVKYGTVTENRETVTAKEYGGGLAIGRRTLINDDLGAFADFTSMIAQRVASDENALIYTLLASNGPTMSDSVALFNAASHGNKAASGTTIDVTNIAAAVAAMRNQTSLDGIKLNIGPRYLVVGTAYELVARQLLATVQPTQASEVNPYSGAFELVVDANNSGNRWMMFADPGMLPTVVYGYVSGANGPQIRTETDFDDRSLKVAVGLDFGCGVIDYRGAYLNAGT